MDVDDDRLVARLNSLLSALPMHVETLATRRGDGRVEIHGFGFPCVGDDEACADWLVALADVDPDADPDDIRDQVLLAIPDGFET